MKSKTVVTQAVTSYQNGSLQEKNNAWYSVYYITVNNTRKLSWHRLAAKADYSHRSQALSLHHKHMLTVNGGGDISRLPAMTLSEFFDTVFAVNFMPKHIQPTTRMAYLTCWNNHIQPRLGEMKLADVRPVHVTRMLEQILSDNPTIARGTLRLIKSVTSGVFAYARGEGAIDTANPVQGTRLPRGGKPARKRTVWTLALALRMLEILPTPAREMFAVAIFAALRRGEVSGLRWENYNGAELDIKQSVWTGRSGKNGDNILACKTESSLQTVPVILTLKHILDGYRDTLVRPTGWMFSHKLRPNQPIDSRSMDAIILRCAESLGLGWRGWHDLRHSTATILYELGTPSKIVQRVLRHANVRTTEDIYIHPTDAGVTDAMDKLETAVRRQRDQRLN